MVDGKSQDLASLFEDYPNNTAYLEVYDLRNGTNTYVLRDCVYLVLYSARASITGYFAHFFDGTVDGFDPSSVDYSTDIMQTIFNNGNATLQTVTNTFAKLATSMTNSMRQNGYDVEKAQGLTYKNEVFIKVRWAWLTLPITLVLLSIVFLAVTMKAERQCRYLEVLKLDIAIPWSTGRQAQRYRSFDPTNGGAGQEPPSHT